MFTGIPAVLLGIICFFYLKPSIKHLKWLTAKEHNWLAHQLESENEAKPLSHLKFYRVFSKPQVWLATFILFTINVGFNGVAFWTPQIIKSIGTNSNLVISVLSGIPYFVAAVSVVLEMMWGFHATESDPSINAGIWYNFGVSVDWLNAFPDQPRKYAWFNFIDTTNGKPFLDEGMTPSMQKYLYAGNLQSGLLTATMPILRYADVLMVYAEAANKVAGRPTEKAVWAINQIINRANGYVPNSEEPLATIDMSAEAFDDKVIQERNWELCFEEAKRWFDIIRTRTLKQVVKPEYQINFTEDDYLWPIPLYDLRNDPNLTQNPGYPLN